MNNFLIQRAKSCLTLKPKTNDPLGILKNVDILVVDGKIEKIGKVTEEEIAAHAPQKLNGDRYVILPGLIDCHTHMVFGGSRENEFALRLEGKSYEEILKAGGGILSTVSFTREESFEELYYKTQDRLALSLAQGITTVEIKSGYGLNTETELKMLRIIAGLKKECPQSLHATFLGAHAFPLEYREAREQYIDVLINEMIPQVSEEALAEFCDVFCDEVAFSVDEAERILQVAMGYGMRAKVHADQLSDTGGAILAGRVGAISAEHLHYVSMAGISALKRANVVAVLLPGASFFLGAKHYASARAMLDADLSVALATDFNPGSSMTENLPFIGTLAALSMNMTLPEVVRAITINAARALGIENKVGSIEVGKDADLLLLDIPDYRTFFYHFATNHKKIVLKKGKIVYEN